MVIARATLVIAALVGLVAAAPDPATRQRLTLLEQRVQVDPENIVVGAEYRTAIIETGEYDRAIDFFERLTTSKTTGPNAYISLAMSYVDKVPAAGDLRRLYLGRDAMSALTKSIAQRPCALAFYLRGLINLYYNRFIFKRTDKGIADLERALSLTTPQTPPALLARIYTSLGDGWYKIGDPAKAHDYWTTGLAKFPDNPALKERLAKQGTELEWAVGAALAAERRNDTTLAGLLPP